MPLKQEIFKAQRAMNKNLRVERIKQQAEEMKFAFAKTQEVDNQTQITGQSPQAASDSAQSPTASRKKISLAEKQNAAMEDVINEIKQSQAVVYTQHPRNKFFSFQNQQVANSPYHLVIEKNDQHIIKQTDYENLYQKPTEGANSLDFDHMKGRD